MPTLNGLVKDPNPDGPTTGVPNDKGEVVFTDQHNIICDIISGDHTSKIPESALGPISILKITNLQATLNGKQPLDSDLTAIADLTPANNDIIQRKDGSWTNRTPTQFKTDLVLTKSDVGLSNVDNTSDLDKPVSTATQTALNGKADTGHTHVLTNVTDVTITASDLNSLDDGIDSDLHFHSSDRDRANHTGTQPRSTISDFAHQSTHQSGGSDALTGNLDAIAKTTVRKNSGGADVGSRRRLNFIEGTNVTITAADDPTDEEIDITISSSGGGGGVTDGDKGDITVSDGGTTWTIDNDVVTFAKMQNIATDRLLGRDTAASGDPEEITVGGGLEFTGSGGIQTSALSGDVTKSAGGTTTTISNNAVTNAKLRDSAALSVIGRATNSTGDPDDISAGANDRLLRRVSDTLDFGQLTVGMVPNDLITYAKIQNVSATNRLLGRITTGAGDIEELTGTQATSLLDTFTSSSKGLAPASGGGTTNFLRADGSWAAPPSGGGGSSIPVSYTFVGANTTWTNKPSALTELLGNVNRRLTIDLTNATQFRLILDVQTAGVNSSSVIGVQYSTDSGSTWRGLDNGTSGSNSTVTLSDNPAGSKVSAWTNLASGAKADVLVRIAGSGGNGSTSPAYNIIAVQFK